ncbi:hypothetical protein HS088_TW13G01018 [Tripterygium wilfordii]|uniref:Uncharacterized protein n=1 Tax=Tripterygium wilfordii TaxID=458696 RepID=A0A7J7CVM9_TRIWF|nr:uncharacterized protein LOC120012174 [Tripterygium wilfordii]KAF5738123.1 hypothetical protein HS088_TW13G01018 [Tripterygium wilfordii]
METPSSTRRITRSQARAQALTTLNSGTNNNSENNDSNLHFSRKLESEYESALSKSRTRNSKQQQQQDRSALFDMTNDSPIVGLATASLETPSSAIAKQKSNRAKAALTPGSGEALLRGQVKTLLQRVEEEQLKIPNLSESGDEVNSNGMASITPLPVIEEQLKICQVDADIVSGSNPESLESQKSLNRSLLLDFSEKSEITDSSDCSSVVTDQGGLGGGSVCTDKSSMDDCNTSVWSIQVNASSTHDEEEEEMIEQEDDDFYYHNDNEEEEEVQEEGEDGGLLDALCEGISKISVADKFSGKHTRFVYNSDDDEIVDKYEEEEEEEEGASPSVLRLKGLPTPKGKHLRFLIEGDDN